MPRNPSNKSTATRSSSFEQRLIDEPPFGIEARFVHEKDLKPDLLQWLGLDGSPHSVGISPAYSKSGGLPALACAVDTRVIIVEFYSTKPNLNGGPTGSGTQIRNAERRNLLQEQLLCHPLCTLYAFDLAPLALSLHQFHLRVTEAIDIQSAVRIPNRSVVDSVQKVLGDASQIFSKNIIHAFENMLYPTQPCKNMDFGDLVQRAWLCWYIGQSNSEAIRDMFDKAPKVDTATFSQNELNILQNIEHKMLRKDTSKPQSITRDINAQWDSKKQKPVIQSRRYANRVTANSTLSITVAYGKSSSYSLPVDTSSVRGKSAGLKMETNLEGKNIISVTAIEKDARTRAERDRGDAILSMLQGTIPVLDNVWMKTIWLPDEPVVWPASFTPPPDAPAIEVNIHPKAPLNPSQHAAINRMLSPSLDDNIILIQGPPGTGKTTVIATYVISAIQAGKGGIWLVAQSNVAMKNIAEKLAKLEFFKFKLLVSQSFHFEWHEHLYEKIRENIIVSDIKPVDLRKALQGTRVILCTLSMISNRKLQEVATQIVPIINVIVDEASQIEVGQYMPLFQSFGETLRKICFVGDDKQLPPHGPDDQNVKSIFEIDHLRESFGVTFLNTQYRMPSQIGDFISEHVYEGLLRSHSGHEVPSSTIACRFIDVNGSEQLDKDGNSHLNLEEVKAVLLLAQRLQDENVSFRIITPYDAQRSAIEEALREEDFKWEDKCFNIDSFQGNEDHVIIISMVRSREMGFLDSKRRMNVMLTRCQRVMYIVSSQAFLKGKGADSLVGKMAAELGEQPGAWLTYKDGKLNREHQLATDETTEGWWGGQVEAHADTHAQLS